MARKRFKDYQEYLKSDEWSSVKEYWYSNNNDHATCRVTMTDASDEPMVLHHWRYPKDWNDDSHENLILISCKVHEWIHDNYHDEHLGWADEVCLYVANLNYFWYDDMNTTSYDDAISEIHDRGYKIKSLEKDLEHSKEDLEECVLLKNHYRIQMKKAQLESKKVNKDG